MRDMHWFVICEDFNGRNIRWYDIFRHYGFFDDVQEAYKKHCDDFDAFSDAVRRSLSYYFWSKCEWEVIVGSWPSSDRVLSRKVDVFEQVDANWDVFIMYVWEQAHKSNDEWESYKHSVPATEENMAKFGWVRERTCEIEHVKGGARYDVWRCSACGYEYAESVSETSVVQNYCPNCGRKVEA